MTISPHPPSRRATGSLDRGIDAPRFQELRTELGDDGLASVLAVLAKDLEQSARSLQAGPDVEEAELQRIVHRLVGTLAQFGLSGHAEVIRGHGLGGAAGKRPFCAMADALDDALRVIADESRRLVKGRRRNRTVTLSPGP